MRTRFRNMSLQVKITAICFMANLIVLVVNMIMLFAVDDMAGRLDTVYQGNLKLNELSVALDEVQNGMTEYLNAKTSDSLEDYYRSEQEFSSLAEELSNRISNSSNERMERNIRKMSEKYLDAVGQTIEAKRGRNVVKYSKRYENASTLYEYLKTNIYSLNSERLQENSSNYAVAMEAFKTFEIVSAIVMMVVIFGNLIIIARVTATIIKPLKALTKEAQEVTKGNFDIELTQPESEDEIGVVTGTFNQMVLSIQQYIEQIRQNAETEKNLRERELMIETSLKDAQLQYLQAQINPHFLFNTLNAGAQLAMMEGADRTYEYVQVMAEFFRYNVKKGSKTVTIGEEIELIDHYLYILNVRFSGDIKYVKEIDNGLLNVEMPSMILQPIVENCVNHGIREMMGEGCITIKVYPIDDVACISISDNGVGMDEATIDRIMNETVRESNDSKNFNGIGMGNVISRLKLFCEYDEVMTIASEGEGCGTEFILYLPMKEREESYV